MLNCFLLLFSYYLNVIVALQSSTTSTSDTVRQTSNTSEDVRDQQQCLPSTSTSIDACSTTNNQESNQFACEICGQKFQSKKGRASHKRIHSRQQQSLSLINYDDTDSSTSCGSSYTSKAKRSKSAVKTYSYPTCKQPASINPGGVEFHQKRCTNVQENPGAVPEFLDPGI
jgi:hypothetical protein